jgi:hypothetical protein
MVWVWVWVWVKQKGLLFLSLVVEAVVPKNEDLSRDGGRINVAGLQCVKIQDGVFGGNTFIKKLLYNINYF